MSNIKLARIDSHFIHGQYAIRWCEAYDCNLIIIVNDELTTNKVRQGLLDMAVPDSIISRYYTLEKALLKLKQLSNEKQAMLICESLADLKHLIDGGIEVPFVNLGRTLPASKTRHFTNYVSLSNPDVEILNELSQRGITIDMRRLPEDELSPIASPLD